jgi:hypothetical protein
MIEAVAESQHPKAVEVTGSLSVMPGCVAASVPAS